MKIVRIICSIIVGATFIFSGLMKAIDPIGGMIKFTDYFQAMHLTFFNSLTLALAILLASYEFLLGIHLLFQVKSKLVALFTLPTMVFFTLVTLWVAITNPVTDCGCFGDAIKLTNWETFLKNIILLVFTAIIFIERKKFINQIAQWRQWLFSILAVVFILFINIYSYKHLPIIDFRPYSIGSNIKEKSTIPTDAEQPEYETLFILEKEGTKKTFDVNNYPYNDTTWIFVESKTKIIKAGYQPPIHDFILNSELDGDITEKVLSLDKPLFLMIAYNINDVNDDAAKKFVSLYNYLETNNIEFYCVTASTTIDILKFDRKHLASFPYLSADETTLKTIIRSNPGLVLLQEGTVLGKWHYNDIPDADSFANPLSASISNLQNTSNTKALWLMLALLILAPIGILRKKHN